MQRESTPPAQGINVAAAKTLQIHRAAVAPVDHVAMVPSLWKVLPTKLRDGDARCVSQAYWDGGQPVVERLVCGQEKGDPKSTTVLTVRYCVLTHIDLLVPSL